MASLVTAVRIRCFPCVVPATPVIATDGGRGETGTKAGAGAPGAPGAPDGDDAWIRDCFPTVTLEAVDAGAGAGALEGLAAGVTKGVKSEED